MRRTATGRQSAGLILLLALYVPAAGCVGHSSSNVPADASTVDTGTVDGGMDSPIDVGVDAGVVDAGPRCDPNKPFGSKKPLDNINSSGLVDGARLTADEKTAYFSRNLALDAGAAVGGYDIYMATRPSTSDPFTVGLPLNGGNTISDEAFPAVTSNGLVIYAGGPGAGIGDIFVASRLNTSSPFSAFAPLANVASAEYEGAPYVLGDQSALYFEGDHAGGVGGRDIYRASYLGGGVFQAPQLVGGVNTTEHESAPVVTSDERTIYFAAKRGSAWDMEVYVARRPSTSVTFGASQPVTEINSNVHDYPTWVSDDDCVIVWSTGASSMQVYTASRPK